MQQVDYENLTYVLEAMKEAIRHMDECQENKESWMVVADGFTRLNASFDRGLEIAELGDRIEKLRHRVASL